MDATPGYPLCELAATNKQFLKWDGVTYDAERADYLWALVERRLEDQDWDPFRLFIKDEPHKVEKIAISRWRLISAGSLIDQMVDRMLFYDSFRDELDAVWDVPVKPGFCPFFGGAQRAVAAFKRPLAIDKKLWDWSSPGWVYDMDCELRKRMAYGPGLEKWRELVQSRFDYVFKRAKLVLSNGHMYEQQTPGFMKSGFYLTISTNSRAQLFLHLAALDLMGLDYVPFMSLGDDTLQEDMEDRDQYIEKLRSLGCRPDDVELDYEFAGFNLRTREPCYWDKHVVNLLYSEEGELLADTLDSYQRLYYRSPKLEWIQGLLQKVAPDKLLSREALTMWAATGFKL
jgi:hypothetical protein